MRATRVRFPCVLLFLVQYKSYTESIRLCSISVNFIIFFFQQAVMLFGGWSRNMADFVTMYDLESLKDGLVSWGFAEDNVRTFFANGIRTSGDDGE